MVCKENGRASYHVIPTVLKIIKPEELKKADIMSLCLTSKIILPENMTVWIQSPDHLSTFDQGTVGNRGC